MNLYNDILNRKIPQIIASYFIAGTTFILFMDWLVNRYSLPEYYTTMALFGVIAILPSVIISSYFHGAPGKDQWNMIEIIGVPVNIILILLVFFIGHQNNWWFEEDKDDILRNFYVHVTSNKDYLNNYYVDYGYGSVHYYDENEYVISSIEESLIAQIKKELFNNVSSEYANQDVNIDMSFANSEVDILNKLYFPKFQLTDEQIDTVKITLTEIKNILSKRIAYYHMGLPDVLLRYFIYKLTDIINGKEFYFMEEAAVWGESLRETARLQWTPWGNEYEVNDQGIKKLTEDLISRCEGKIAELRYGSIIGKVIEKLDHETVKIKLKKPGLLKKKMKLSTKRQYHWGKGGAEIKIEDYELLLNYLENTEARIIWQFFNNDSLDPEYEVYDKLSWKDYKIRNIKHLVENINDIKVKLENNLYDEETKSIHDDTRYDMEVIEVQDSIAYAKIIGSRNPVFKVRENDWIFISK